MTAKAVAAARLAAPNLENVADVEPGCGESDDQSAMPAIVDFWAAWCAPCRMIAPVLEEIAEEYDGQLKVTKLDVDQNPQVATQFGVMSIPTMILFKDGEAVERLVGYMPKDRLLEKITLHL